ncbi:hypothetical protein CPB83DRAFT_116592 [Crepidotus variabilis]|uniref:Phosphatidate cytidylyltransferase n=1 Tax=Crepidotus variabilis TaxID=179855 RepID=A0A9P6JIW6_9AGAR|nr:hypothetical protein CPB83DRAFT_116592 [Crepidotus variabilis]
MAAADIQQPPTTPARRSSRPRRSSTPRSPPPQTTSKRSPSPIISSLSAENPKGVKNITRKVIKRLEGLGHLEMLVDSDFVLPEEEEVGGDNEEKEVEKVLYAIGQESLRSNKSGNKHKSNGHATNGHANGNSQVDKLKKAKTDFEIPRKVLHSSIGFLTLYLYASESDVSVVVRALWLALCVIVPADLLRFKSKWFARTYERYLGFLMRESEKVCRLSLSVRILSNIITPSQNSVNGVIWYIIGVNFALAFYPQDVATVAILILSWADTSASTFGRLYGSATRKLPSRLPILRLPLAPRKSLAGFIAASVTGAAIAAGFWGLVAPVRFGGRDLTWEWTAGVRQVDADGTGAKSFGFGGPVGLLLITVVAGLVSGVAEALDLPGSLDDNLTLPIISGGCILGFIKLLGVAASWLSS